MYLFINDGIAAAEQLYFFKLSPPKIHLSVVIRIRSSNCQEVNNLDIEFF